MSNVIGRISGRVLGVIGILLGVAILGVQLAILVNQPKPYRPTDWEVDHCSITGRAHILLGQPKYFEGDPCPAIEEAAAKYGTKEHPKDD